MKAKRTALIGLLILAVSLSIAGRADADVSSAAVLYLRIAPGARAAGLGEAYVAVAEDATATHWNPAGLGAHPIADSWVQVSIPSHLRPVSAIAAVRTQGGSDYLAYDVWAVTSEGLARYDNKKWHLSELFSTRTDQTLAKVVASYFNITDEDRTAVLAAEVARANSPRGPEFLQELRDSILAAVESEYRQKDKLTEYFDSLVAGYEVCLVNWEKVREIESRFREGMKDSLLTETEADRITVAAERSRNRFIPEEIVIPYGILFSGEITALAAAGQRLGIGTSDGLAVYNGKVGKWRLVTTANGLPADHITSVAGAGKGFFVGTEKGIARFVDDEVAPAADNQGLPALPVTAIAASGPREVWAVADNDLYRFDGISWSNSFQYTVALDDTPERIADRFAVYGTDAEKAKYIEKLTAVLREAAAAATREGQSDTVTAGSLHTGDELTDAILEGTQATPPVAEEGGLVETVDSTMAEEQTEPDTAPEPSLKAGSTVRVPYLAEFKGQVSSLHRGQDGTLWVGTDHGILGFDGERWAMPGYRNHLVEEGQKLSDLATMRPQLEEGQVEEYVNLLRNINDLGESADVSAGNTVKVYRNRAAEPIRRIAQRSNSIYFVTGQGVLEWDGEIWQKAEVGGLGSGGSVDIQAHDDKLWLATERKLTIKANGRKEFTLMHTNWLKELADDMYYEFISYVTPVEGWGTFGGNITFITYGAIDRTGEEGPTVLDTWSPFDIAFTGSYGTSLTRKLKGGFSVKFIYSRLSPQGAGLEAGREAGVATGFALDLGLLYEWTQRLNLGLALTNLGPDVTYIDAAQSDPFPSNLAVGAAFWPIRTDFYHLLLTAETNKDLTGSFDGLSNEAKELVWNAGAEVGYLDLIAFRAGYLYDQEGKLKTVTLGAGLSLLANKFQFDFSYIPKNENVILANTLRISLSVRP